MELGKEAVEAIWQPEKGITNNEGSAQVHFKCIIDVDNPLQYYSLRYNSSLNISGVPIDENALDPVLTQKSIDKKQSVDYSKNDKVPPIFSPSSISHSSCEKDGIFTIIGYFSDSENGKTIENIKYPIQFTMPLTYPDAITLSCSLNNEKEIVCKVDRKIEGNSIIFEQLINIQLQLFILLFHINSTKLYVWLKL